MDLETAKQMAALLEAENARLHQRLKLLVQENARLKGEDVFSLPLIHAAETHWYMLDKGPGKKWYAWTVEVAALFYSLIETALLRGEDPGRYLLRAALVAIENPGTVTRPSSSD